MLVGKHMTKHGMEIKKSLFFIKSYWLWYFSSYLFEKKHQGRITAFATNSKLFNLKRRPHMKTWMTVSRKLECFCLFYQLVIPI